jgi:hypothetical protein
MSNEDQFAADIKDTHKFNDVRLAELRANKPIDSARAILIDKEFERRARIEQHKLDLQLMTQQVRWMKFAVIATILSALLGVILGAYLQRNWPIDQQQKPLQSIQEKTSVYPSAHPAITNDAKSSLQLPKK